MGEGREGGGEEEEERRDGGGGEAYPRINRPSKVVN